MKNENIYYTFLNKEDIEKLGHKILQYEVDILWVVTKECYTKYIKLGNYADEFVLDYKGQKCVCVGAIDKKAQTWKKFMLYDLTGKILVKGNIKTIANALGIDIAMNYKDVDNIEQNPALFLEIYKAISDLNLASFCFPKPQMLADMLYQAATEDKNPIAQRVLKKPTNIILTICEKKGLTRSQLAREIGVMPSAIENCLSRESITKTIYNRLMARYKDIL